jgi:hypothetical protein
MERYLVVVGCDMHQCGIHLIKQNAEKPWGERLRARGVLHCAPSFAVCRTLLVVPSTWCLTRFETCSSFRCGYVRGAFCFGQEVPGVCFEKCSSFEKGCITRGIDFYVQREGTTPMRAKIFMSCACSNVQAPILVRLRCEQCYSCFACGSSYCARVLDVALASCVVAGICPINFLQNSRENFLRGGHDTRSARAGAVVQHDPSARGPLVCCVVRDCSCRVVRDCSCRAYQRKEGSATSLRFPHETKEGSATIPACAGPVTLPSWGPLFIRSIG